MVVDCGQCLRDKFSIEAVMSAQVAWTCPHNLWIYCWAPRCYVDAMHFALLFYFVRMSYVYGIIEPPEYYVNHQEVIMAGIRDSPSIACSLIIFS